jgi:3-mercaptopyruvate sulfurtransferase SseA
MTLSNAIDGAAPLITPNDLDARRNRGEELQIIDVRSARDYAKSHVPGAVNIPWQSSVLAQVNSTRTPRPSRTSTKGSPGTPGRTSCSDTASPA